MPNYNGPKDIDSIIATVLAERREWVALETRRKALQQELAEVKDRMMSLGSGIGSQTLDRLCTFVYDCVTAKELEAVRVKEMAKEIVKPAQDYPPLDKKSDVNPRVLDELRAKGFNVP
jgi:hypothetical protein